ncbi:hypothetical protein ACFPJ4_07165 [Lysinimonas soli]|uniref:Uncharacterized protein n=1 Tax=Lysinimonas soli TaxID=1074233 RepID=A0ABW0NPP1_9MICO
MPSFVITALDSGPAEFEAVLPLRARVLRVVPGPDRADYVLCFAERPIPFRPPAGFDLDRTQPGFRTRDEDGEVILVQGLVVCTRMVGDSFSAGMTGLPINIAYVIDNTVTLDAALDFGKIEFAAIGYVDDSPVEVLLPGEDPAG